MTSADLYMLIFIFFSLGGLASFFNRWHPEIVNYGGHGFAALGSVATALCAVSALVREPLLLPFPVTLPFGQMMARVDGLAAFFLLALGIVGGAASIYAIGYSREYYGRRYGLMPGLFNLFLLSMVLVITASHAAAFIIAWEAMSIVSFLLVIYEYEKPANIRAGFIYLVMTHVGTIFIISAFFLLSAAAGGMDFALYKNAAVSEGTRNIIFLCAFIGFGAKAGMIPLHIWLPKAHPAAPSHVSALMSGVMIKTAIYGMSRFFLDFLGAGPAWWGVLVLVVAVLSCVLGVLYALMEHDLKRLLAYHSVENIGIILLGMGAGMIFMSKGQAVLAGLSWMAALYHVFNHAVFKALLFMGAGAVLQATHTKDIERLGGLIKKMPYTALLFLVGAAAISALPPLNGFVSEWLTFQALFLLPQAIAGVAGKFFGMILIALLGLTGALAAACFVKAFGIVFLAKPRSAQAETAHEASKFMLFPMAGLAALCVLLGVWPQGMIEFLKTVVADFPGVSTGAFFTADWYSVAFASEYGSGGGLSVPLILILLALALIAAAILTLTYGKPRIVSGETWTCGIVPTARMEYTATGFSEPIRTSFRSILQPRHETIASTGSANPYFGRKLSYHMNITYVFTHIFYRPLNAQILRIAHFMKAIQTGSVQLYIGYIMAITVLVLVWSVG